MQTAFSFAFTAPRTHCIKHHGEGHENLLKKGVLRVSPALTDLL